MLPKRLDRKTIYKSDWINLYADKVEMPSGEIIETYHQLDYPNDAVVVLLTNNEGEVCFVKALRYTTQRIQWELPAGGVEKGEDIITTAKRELLEETGYQAKDLRVVYSFNPSNGMSNEVVHIVNGDLLDVERIEFDKDEIQEVQWLSIGTIKQLIELGEVMDGISLIAILFYLNQI